MTTHAPAAPDTAPPAPGPTRSRALALTVLCAGMLMIILDGSIVTVALPAIQDDLHFSPADLTWTVNAYLIAFGGLLLLAGRLGDLIGRKRVFIAGLAVFTAASLLCALATSQGMLIAARFLQGVGGAMASAVSLGMIVTLFPEPAERGRAIGAFSFVGAAGASIGQVLGGALTQALDWHWIFLINLPIGLAAGLLALRVLAPDRGPGLRAGVDAPGAALITAALMLGIYAIVGTGGHGWTSPRTLLLGALAFALLAAFTLRQARAARPLLPLRVFRSRGLSAAAAVQTLMVGGMFGFQVMIALYLQDVRGYGAAATGLALLPAATTVGAVSLLLSARLIARFGERRMLLTGLVLLLSGLALLTRLPVEADYALDVLPTMLLISGFGLAISALTALAMAGVDPRDAGTASGLFGTSQQVGGALGVAVLSTLATGRAHTLAAAGHPAAESLTAGFRLAFAVATGLLALALLLAAILVRPVSKA
ncbi:DHA2 family efflux MFS transporter permease subunit [Kitasatospora sp. NPDC089509]|uniref:DHA2 family efflux MFS transporter permease subunit n=1 Tax=Kitasatospora sp. NPDC089509 TaxID=3364079 RepID=UPI0038191590